MLISGKYALIALERDEDDSTLTIGKRQGAFEGMDSEKDFVIDLLGNQQTIRYSGKEVTVKFTR